MHDIQVMKNTSATERWDILRKESEEMSLIYGTPSVHEEIYLTVK